MATYFKFLDSPECFVILTKNSTVEFPSPPNPIPSSNKISMETVIFGVYNSQ